MIRTLKRKLSYGEWNIGFAHIPHGFAGLNGEMPAVKWMKHDHSSGFADSPVLPLYCAAR